MKVLMLGQFMVCVTVSVKMEPDPNVILVCAPGLSELEPLMN